MKKFLLLLTALLAVSTGIAQDSIQVVKNTLDHQMTEAFEKSNSYQEYKVIKKVQLSSLRKNILDSVSELKRTIGTQNQEIRTQQARIDTLKQNLTHTEENLKVSQQKEDGISLMGIHTTKSAYNGIVFTIIGILLLISGFLFYRFLTSHRIINSAELTIAEMEIEIEDYRRNSLEREQKLRRKLQDEINKNRKMK